VSQQQQQGTCCQLLQSSGTGFVHSAAGTQLVKIKQQAYVCCNLRDKGQFP
jgi:hypothetical protein